MTAYDPARALKGAAVPERSRARTALAFVSALAVVAACGPDERSDDAMADAVTATDAATATDATATDAAATDATTTDADALDAADADVASCVMGPDAQVIDGVVHPGCGCCPIESPSCDFRNGGARWLSGECGYLADAAPPCHEVLDSWGCPALDCAGSCLVGPEVSDLTVDCGRTGDVCLSGLTYTVRALYGGSLQDIVVTSPCGPGRVDLGASTWSPAPCSGTARVTLTACNSFGCASQSVEVAQDLGLAFEQPAASASWQADATQVVRVRSSPALTALAGPTPLAVTLETSLDGGPWQARDPLILDAAGLGRDRVIAPIAPTPGAHLALRATLAGADADQPLPEELTAQGGVVAVTDVALAPSGARAGYAWEQVTPAAAFAPRDGAGAVVLGGKMWLLGGWNPLDPTDFPLVTSNDVWSSADGYTWTRERDNGAPNMWEPRHKAGYVTLGDVMLVVGGDVSQGHMQPDVWRSEDGVAWTEVAAATPWGERVIHDTAVLGDAILVFGGQTLPQFGGPTEAVIYDDVWRSTDGGATWQRILEHAPWAPRGMMGGQAVSPDGTLWLLGGGTYDTPAEPTRRYYDDVWSTADGVTWKEVLAEAPWAPRQYRDVAWFDGRM
ncbi:MAG: hypothetical protein U1F43_00565 [Myxococcota bacterium]